MVSHMQKSIIAICIIFTILFIIGCSETDFTTPVPPSNDEIPELAELSSADPTGSSQAVLGLYQIDIDTATLTGNIEPIRTSQSVDVLESVDITGFLTVSPCGGCVQIMGLGLTGGYHLVVDIGIRHPFPVGDPGQVPSGRNRADIHVFNVEGIIVSDEPYVSDIPSAGIQLATGNLLNPSGYTTNLDIMIDNIIPTDSNAHPYILHFDDYTCGNFAASNPSGFADPFNPSGNLVMKMGSGFSVKSYEFLPPPGENLSFGFAVGCTYGVTTENFLQRLEPEYRCPQHNKKAASQVLVQLLSNSLEQAVPSSEASFMVYVLDINHSAAVGNALDQMAHESKVSSISFHIPGITNRTFNSPTPVSGDGRIDPLVFELSVNNDLNLTSGDLPCLIKILDSYPAGANPNPGLGGADAMGRVDWQESTLFPLDEFATYQFMEIYVTPCAGVDLRQGVTPVDIGIDEAGHSLIAYDDYQVWRYDAAYCTGSHAYTIEIENFETILEIDVQSDGRSIVFSDECHT